MDNGNDPFPTRLAKARDLRGISQTELSKKAAIPASSISHFEAGTRKPSFDNLRRLATVLEVSTDFLLGRIETPGVGDRLHRNEDLLNEHDRDLAQAFIKMLSDRAKKG